MMEPVDSLERDWLLELRVLDLVGYHLVAPIIRQVLKPVFDCLYFIHYFPP